MKLPDEKRLLRGRAAVIDCRSESCGKCLSVCGFSAIRLEEGRPYSDPSKCVGCGGCVSFCPERAIILVKDRGDGTFEVTLPHDGELPGIDDIVGGNARVIQAIPKRPGTNHALVRAVMNANDFRKEFSV